MTLESWPQVCYYRYLRVFPDGTLLYRTTPDILVNVAASLHERGRLTKQGQHVQLGRYVLRASLQLHLAWASLAQGPHLPDGARAAWKPDRATLHDNSQPSDWHQRGRA